MKKQLALLASIVDSSEDAIITKNLDGVITSWNKAAEKIFGYTDKESIGEHITKLIPAHLQKEEADIVFKIKNRQRIEHYETERIKKDGGKVYISLTISPLMDDEGNVIGASKIARDITAKKLSEEKLNKSLQETLDYKFALDESAIVAITDQKGIIKHVNDNFCKISKYSQAELIGQDHRIINSGFHSKDFIKNLWVTIVKGKVWKGELKNKAKDGSFYWVDTTIVPFLNQQGKPYQYLAIRADITERKKAEENVIKLNRLYAFLSAVNQSLVHIKDEKEITKNACKIAMEIGKFQTARIGFLDKQGLLQIENIDGEKDEAGKVVLKYSGVNFNTPQLQGTTTGRVLSTGKHAVSNDAQNDPEMAAVKDDLIRGDIKSVISFPIKRADKVIGVFTFTSNTLHIFDDDEVNLLQEAVGDISFALEIIDNEKTRKRVEEERNMFFDISVDLLCIANNNGYFSSVNPAFEKTFGYKTEEFLTRPILEFIPEEETTLVANEIEKVASGKSSTAFTNRFVCKDGSHRWLEWNVEPANQRMFASGRDITERKKAEDALKESEAFNKGVLASLSSHIAVIDTKGDVLSVNTAWENFAYQNGITTLERVGKGSNYFIACENAIQQGDNIAQAALNGIRSVVNRKKSFFEMRYPCHSPNEERWFMMRVVTFKNEREQVVIAHENITHIVKAEQAIVALNESLESKVKERTAELQDANKELETFSYTVSHDLQSPLRTLSGFSKIMLKDYSSHLDEEGKEILNVIDRSAKRMGDLIHDLLHFSKMGKSPMLKRQVSMSEIVSAIVDEMRYSNKVSTFKITTTKLYNAYCDPALIKQVWANLIGNAVKYSSKANNPLIEIGSTEMNNETVYYVKDNGAGFDMKYANRLFEVFNRLHRADEFEGTGVGLATVQRIVNRHGGRIWAEAKVNQGATFYFTLQ